MIYRIEFGNNEVEKIFMELYHNFEWSESSFQAGDLERNIRNTTTFQTTLYSLKTFLSCVDTEFGAYNDNGFDRIGYARINQHEFVKNGRINYQTLKDALWEIAHPANK